MTDDDKPATTDDDILAELGERMRMAIDAEHEERIEALDDLDFVVGKQWDPHILAQRERERRPCLTINTLPTYLAQVVGDMRENRIGIKVAPVDDMADPETAKVIQGMIRHIENDSGSDLVYQSAGKQAAACGRGYFRLLTDFVGDDSFDQEIKFDAIRNPFTIYEDPFAKHPARIDRSWCCITEDMPRAEFKRQYPKAEACGRDSDHGLGDGFAGTGAWLGEESVRVVEYYRVECEADTLLMLRDGTTVLRSTLPKAPPDGEVIKERPTERRKVMHRKCTAVDILETTEIPCDIIPVFRVSGEEIDINGRVYTSGLVRFAKDPARMYNAWMSSATEEITMRTKAPWIIAEGQVEGYEALWNTANTVSHAWLPYKPTSVDGSQVPPPMRQSMADVPAGVLTMASHARDDIKATMGLFDASIGARGTATSGKQELAQQRQGQVSTSHFAASVAVAARAAGVAIVSMIPRVYDTQRVVRIMGDDDVVTHETINKPMAVPKPTKSGAIQTVLHDMTVGKYDVTIGTGPSYATSRAEAADDMTAMAQAWPKLMDVAGDRMIRAKMWPDADLIADRIKKTMPPELMAGENKDEPQGPQVPPQIQQQLQQYDAALNDAMQQIEAMKKEQQTTIEQAQIKAQADVQIAIIKAQADIEAKTQAHDITAQYEAANRPPEPEEPEEPQPDMVAEALAMVAQAVAAQTAAVAAPKRKVMRIQAPSGGVYEGEIIEGVEDAATQ